MPLVAHSDLPSFERLRSAGQEVLTLANAPGTRTFASCTWGCST